MSGLYLARLNPADIDQILKIEKTSFQWPWQRISFEGELDCKDSLQYIVKHQSAGDREPIIAYAFLRCLGSELEILRIAVASEWRQRGVGSLLLNHCLQQAFRKSVEMVFLEVRPSNSVALAFYRKFGFREVGRRPRYYNDTGEDALILKKSTKEVV